MLGSLLVEESKEKIDYELNAEASPYIKPLWIAILFEDASRY